MKFQNDDERRLIETFETTDWVSTQDDVKTYQKLAQNNLKKKD